MKHLGPRRGHYYAFGFTFLIGAIAMGPPPKSPLQVSARTGATNESGDRDVILEWNAQSNVTYRVQSRPGFESNTPWSTFDIAPAGAATFKVPIDRVESGSDQSRRFFRICAPSNEIVSIEPAV